MQIEIHLNPDHEPKAALVGDFCKKVLAAVRTAKSKDKLSMKVPIEMLQVIYTPNYKAIDGCLGSAALDLMAACNADKLQLAIRDNPPPHDIVVMKEW